MATGDRPTLEMIYIGRRINTKGKVRPFWLMPDGTTASFSGREGGKIVAPIGGVVECEHTPDNPDSLFLATRKYLRVTDHPDFTEEWALGDRLAVEHQRRLSTIKRLAEENADLSDYTLRELHTAALTMNVKQRAALVAVVLGEIGVMR